MKNVIIALALSAAVATPLRAELKYTLHFEIRTIDTPAAEKANPMAAMAGDAMIKQMMPDGPADVVCIVGEHGTRTEFVKGAMGQLAGTVTLALPNGDFVGINPKDQTYWRMATPDLAAATQGLGGLKPHATSTRTGEFSTIAGVRVERVAFQLTIDLPIPDEVRAQLPPDFPTSLSMTGDTWQATDQFQKYAAMAVNSKSMDFAAALGVDTLMQGGLMMRQVMRSPVFGGHEMESVITKIAEEDVPASLFEIPKGFKEVPAPNGIRRHE